MAYGAREAFFDVLLMFLEAGIGHDIRKIVALAAQGIWPVDAQVRIRKKIRNRLAGKSGVAEFIPALKDVRPL